MSGQERKGFFFEKKKQKIFGFWRRAGLIGLRASSGGLQ
jgi:hypothetical protein